MPYSHSLPVLMSNIATLIVAVLNCATTTFSAPTRPPTSSHLPISYDPCPISSINDLAAAKKSCYNITIGDLVVPAGKTLDLTQLNTGTTVTFTGKVTFGYTQWVGPLVSVSGTEITVKGTSSNVLDGYGAAWWDGKGSAKGKIKPKFFFAHGLTNSTIKGLNIRNTPVHCFSISSSQDLLIDSVTIDNRDGDVGNLGHNTDGFDINYSSRVIINNATVYNQDDCLAVNSGNNIKFTNGYCSGGHGISMGSIGSGNVVHDIVVSGSTIVNSDNGVRIKTIRGATGSVYNITYSNITLQGITQCGIAIQQNYLNGVSTGKPTAGVPIKHITLSHVRGTVSPKGKGKCISCASCSDFTFSDVSVIGTGEVPIKSECVGAPPEIAC